MKKVGFVGAGNMAGALIRGLLRAGRVKTSDLIVSDVVEGQVRRLKRQHKVEGTRDNRQLVRDSQTIILAVKPQAMAAVLEDIRRRDERDSGREASPMRPADDAFLLDTSNLDIEAAFDTAVGVILRKVAQRGRA